MTNTPNVRVGQVWADNDKRSAGRHVLIVAIEDGQLAYPFPDRAVVALCTPDGRVIFSGRNGKETRTRIRLDRFRPTASGYRLVKDTQGGAS